MRISESQIRRGSSGPHGRRELVVLTSRHCVKFHSSEDRRIAGETEFRKVFALDMQADSLADIESQFIQGGSLRDHGKIEAPGHKLAFAFGYAHLDRSLHCWLASDYSMHQDCTERRVRVHAGVRDEGRANRRAFSEGVWLPIVDAFRTFATCPPPEVRAMFLKI